jgi:hypothetical protein
MYQSYLYMLIMCRTANIKQFENILKISLIFFQAKTGHSVIQKEHILKISLLKLVDYILCLSCHQ